LHAKWNDEVTATRYYLQVKKTIQKQSAVLLSSIGRGGLSASSGSLPQMKLLQVAEASLRVADSALISAAKCV
jgi:hypothetical protein